MRRIALLLTAFVVTVSAFGATDEERVAPLMQKLFDKNKLLVTRLSLDSSGRRHYLAVVGFEGDKWEDNEPAMAIFDLDPAEPKLIASDDDFEWCESLRAVPLAHNGIDFLATYFSAGARSYCERFYWFDGHELRPLAECIGAPKVMDLDRDGVDEIVSAPQGPPYSGPRWPGGPWQVFKLEGAKLVEHDLDYLMTCGVYWGCSDEFAGHDVSSPRVLTVTNETFDDVADPDVELEINGECILEGDQFNRHRTFTRTIRLLEHNTISLLTNDDAVIRVEISDPDS